MYSSGKFIMLHLKDGREFILSADNIDTITAKKQDVESGTNSTIFLRQPIRDVFEVSVVEEIGDILEMLNK